MSETDVEVQRKGLWLGMTLLFKVQSVSVKDFKPCSSTVSNSIIEAECLPGCSNVSGFHFNLQLVFAPLSEKVIFCQIRRTFLTSLSAFLYPSANLKKNLIQS